MEDLAHGLQEIDRSAAARRPRLSGVVDISGLDLSFDAKEVVFSMRRGGDDDHYHIYKAKLDGTRVKQLTFGPYDDIRPIYVPGKRIAFATNQMYTEMGTRADEYEHSR